MREFAVRAQVEPGQCPLECRAKLPRMANHHAARHDVVSDEAEILILVDADDAPVGTLDKAACHDGDGVLHRAFSLFVFNANGETLLQRRHAVKRLWPGYWSNGCCSHPRAGEALLAAVKRRAEEELGLAVEPEFLFKFRYQATYRRLGRTLGTEHELCSVFAGRSDAAPRVNATEVADWRWVAPAALDRELKQTPEAFTPWLKLEWGRVRAASDAL